MNKTTIILLIVLVLGAFAYFFVLGGNSSSDTLLFQQNPSGISDNVGTEILALLNQIQSIEIDASIFSSPVYQTLRDYSVPIPPQNVGRQNPFAPIR